MADNAASSSPHGSRGATLPNKTKSRTFRGKIRCATVSAAAVASRKDANSSHTSAGAGQKVPKEVEKNVKRQTTDCLSADRRAARVRGVPREAAKLKPKMVPEGGTQPAAAEKPPKFTPTGRRRALLIGCVYRGTPIELMGCLNDVDNMYRLVTETWGFKAEQIRTLKEDDPDNLPTKKNICDSLRWLVRNVLPGDTLFLFFSGHGAQVEDPMGVEEDGLNETLIPLDFKVAGMITDDQINSLIVRPLPEGAKLFAVLDCCSSGSALDLPFSWTGEEWKEDVNPLFTCGDIQLLSGCRDGDISLDTVAHSGETGGAMTKAFCEIIRNFPGVLDYRTLAEAIRVYMRLMGVVQHPQLSSSQPFDTTSSFSLSTIVPNMNAELGQIIRKVWKVKPAPPIPNLIPIRAGAAGVILLLSSGSGLPVIILRARDSE